MDSAIQGKKWTLQYPELGTSPVPVEATISPGYFERERRNVFKCSWLNIATSSEIPEPGDYIVRELEILGTSVLLVRGKDGRVRGFHNVCKHRGNILAKACSGKVNSFVCGFHGWAFDTTGTLVHVPDEDQFHDLNKSDFGLTPIEAAEWNGFVFASLKPRETLGEALGEWGEQFAHYPFGEMRPVGHYTTSVRVNWKVFMVAFLECYHVPRLHRRIVPDAATGEQNPLCHLLSVRLQGRHRSCSVYGNPNHVPSPAEGLAFKYGPTVIQGEKAKSAKPNGVNPENNANWAFDMNGIFPNLILHVGNGFFYKLVFWPQAVDRTRWDVELYMSPASNAGERISQEFSKILTRDLYREDLSTVESIQTGLASGGLSHFPLSDQELLVRHTFRVIDDAVRFG